MSATAHSHRSGTLTQYVRGSYAALLLLLAADTLYAAPHWHISWLWLLSALILYLCKSALLLLPWKALVRPHPRGLSWLAYVCLLYTPWLVYKALAAPHIITLALFTALFGLFISAALLIRQLKTPPVPLQVAS